MSVWRRARRVLGCPTPPAAGVFARQREQYARARVLVACYYAVLFYLALGRLGRAATWARQETYDFLWPVKWVGWFSSPEGPVTCLLVFLLAGTFAGLCFPGRRWARAVAFTGFFLAEALGQSRGKIGHSHHMWVLTSFLLVFLPDAGCAAHHGARAARQRYLLVLGGCQAGLLLSYTMAGTGKLLGAVSQILAGEPHVFMPSALARHIAARLLQTGDVTVLGSWIVGHAWVGWPLMLMTLYLQLFSLGVLFRPALHRAWGLALIAMHVVMYLTITVGFFDHVLLVALLLPGSPFAVSGVTTGRRLADLPVLGRPFHPWGAAPRAGQEPLPGGG